MKNKTTVNKAMKQIRELSQDELVARNGELRKEKFLLRAQAKSGQLENPAKIRTARRNLARVMTELNKRASAGK
jgi:large subunit ribosomal protein L29